eukprot:g52811.t1
MVVPRNVRYLRTRNGEFSDEMVWGPEGEPPRPLPPTRENEPVVRRFLRLSGVFGGVYVFLQVWDRIGIWCQCFTEED